ncbi:uncharacterized protein N7483_008903 [Penicillium malachiteum]|uniref:uncharacterized protein n=1 Tax=Penicillium malachiteum TaxID=1324776 RepID=UPI0025481802|nr:uncharacterized protein N7483_008903 [Penicillium malachiteum]KAJ5720969.1 hypothetical protein N7483_008903 [Penicillium malachiteum]
MSAGTETASFPIMTTGGPTDDSTWLEISDFEYDYVTVSQEISSLNVGGEYEVSLAWSLSSNTSSYEASCLLEISIDSTTILGSGQSGAGVRPFTGAWETVTATYTPTASTSIPFEIYISCYEGQSSDSPIVGVADISMVSSTCYTTTSVSSSTSSTVTTTSDTSVTTPASSGATASSDSLIPTDAISTATSSASTVSASATATSTTSSTWTASTGTVTTDDDGTSTLTGSTTDGDSASASISVDSDDSTSSVSGTVSVTSSSVSRKRDTLSCTLYVYQGLEEISSTTVDAGSSASFVACLAADSSDTVDILVDCNGSGGTVIVSELAVGSGASVNEKCVASTSTTSTSSQLSSTSAKGHPHTWSSAPGSSSVVHTRTKPGHSESTSLPHSQSSEPIYMASTYSPGPVSGSKSETFTSYVHFTYVITDTIISYTTICPETAIETAESSTVSFAGSSISVSPEYTSTLPVPTTTQSASAETSQVLSGVASAGYIETADTKSTRSSDSLSSESEAFTFTTYIPVQATGSAGSINASEKSSAATETGSDVSTTAGATAAEGTAVNVISESASGLTTTGSSLIVSSISTAATQSVSPLSTSAPLFNGAISAFSPSLTGIISILLALVI